MKGIFLHILADTLGSAGVIVSTILIKLTGWTVFDPLASMFIASLILVSSIPLLKSSMNGILFKLDDRNHNVVKNALNQISMTPGITGYTTPRFWPSQSSSVSMHGHSHGHSHSHSSDHTHEHEHKDEHEHEHHCCHHHDHDDHDHCCCGHHHDHDDDDDEDEHEHHHDHEEDDHEEHCCHHHHDHDHEDDDDHDEHEHHHHDEDGHCCCGHHHHHHHDHDADEVFTSWGVETAKKFSKADIEHALTELDGGKYGMILRSKGIVDGGADGWLEFDYVPGEWEVRQRGADVGGKLVVIGSKLDEKAIAALFGC